MIIDCDSCTVRGAACTDCVVTFLTIPVRPARWGQPAGGALPATSTPSAPSSVPARPAAGGQAGGRPVDLDDGERAAIDVLASSGLVPPLRMVRAM